MSKLDVRIVNLEPMRVASAYGFGASPEAMAHKKMTAFLEARNLLGGYGTKRRHFGFNNPSPSAGSPNYGYEIWTEVGPDVDPEGDIRIVDFCQSQIVRIIRFQRPTTFGQVGERFHSSALPAVKPAINRWLAHCLHTGHLLWLMTEVK